MTSTRTRQDINSQTGEAITAAGLTWARATAPDGRLGFVVEGEWLTPGQAADRYLPGGFAANFGRTYPYLPR